MDVNGGGTAASDGELIFQTPNGTDPLPYYGLNVGEKFRVTRDGAKVTGELEVTGDITALTSDIRLKTDIESIDNALDKVDQLNGYYFEWNNVAKNLDGGKSFKEGVEVGVSAQEIEKVLPEVVTEAPIVKIENLDVDYKTVYYDKIVPLLIEAIKELRAEVKKLKEDK